MVKLSTLINLGAEYLDVLNEIEWQAPTDDSDCWDEDLIKSFCETRGALESKLDDLTFDINERGLDNDL
jgi:hypothetical protein